ncbi:MAG: flagellar biosynthetic protein FliO [Armatimonadota bacterium]|nr:flagellar biosynthetic protein FliO [Armatimonadota bacterium]
MAVRLGAALAGLTMLPAVALAQDDAGVAGRSPWALLGQALLSLAVVVAVIYLVYFGLRRLSDRGLGMEAEGPMRVVQARHLGGDRWLYLVEIDGRRLVIGATSAQLSRIAELGPMPGEGDGRREPTP